MPHTRRAFLGTIPLAAAAQQQSSEPPIPIGNRRELFLDRTLLASLSGTADLRLATPIDAGPALHFDKPWEGAFSAYTTILHDAAKGLYRMYYRGSPGAGEDGNSGEATCYAESDDGKTWRKPAFDQYEVRNTKTNNVLLANRPPYSHNFTPFLDLRPNVPATERYKAMAGVHKTGLMAFVSPDGTHWKPLRDTPVFPPPKDFSLDSQNIAFWSQAEQKYVLYYRSWKRINGTNYRWVSRATSDDFLHWTPGEQMSYGDAPPEHLYTNQTSPYFRAPHIYIGICARFMPGRQVLTAAQAAELNVDPKYFQDCSDAVLVTSRGGNQYTRTFMDAFLRPGLGLENWVSRSNYPALNLVQTSPSTMSFYVNRNYGQPTAYLRRYELRLDGLASIHAGYAGGEAITKPLQIAGNKLELNFATSAAGSVRIELQDVAGKPLPGYELSNAPELIGDEIAREYRWKSAQPIDQPVRIRFVLKDADIFAFRASS
ncbi:hypothetical protein F183_A50700 [Bryobacterales bacterium F-183]|nr:hypothetical protein F183_A50700 [Bryobacterales bacterium F-183]